jgi:S1-C subfamily serine protease
VGFAIPANIVARVAPVLIEEGEFTWPWLGLEGTQPDAAHRAG